MCSLKKLHQSTGSIIDYSVDVTHANVAAVTMRILEDMVDVLLELGYCSPEEAYRHINDTSDLISWVEDFGMHMNHDTIPIEEHRKSIFDHLMKLAE